MSNRIKNSAYNLFANIGLTVVMILMGFITRKVFVDNVGIEYLGLNGLLQNILGVMTLLEGGFATSVIYNMYKPLAEDDRPRVLALLQLYKKVYLWIAFGIFVFSFALYPFLNIFVKGGDDLQYVSIVYFIFVFNSLIGYFTAYKWSLINASQQNFKLAGINLLYQVGLSLAKLLILYYTKNYLFYLLVEALFGVGLNYAIVHKANKLFPYIVTRKKYVVEQSVKANIITNMKALFLHKIGGYFMHSTDNIIISSFVGVAVVGFYSNYTLLTGIVNTMVNQVLNSFSESVGNLIASEASQKIYEVFKVTFFVNFIVSSVPVIVLSNMLTPFISWWLGNKYLLDQWTVSVILVNFYIDTMRSTALTFKTKSGIFVQDRFTPLLQGFINVFLSLFFVKLWGLTGVLFGTTISLLSIGFWQFPRLCYKYVFKRPLKMYFKTYTGYTFVAMFCLFISKYICNLLSFSNMLVETLANGLVSIVVIIIIYFVVFFRTAVFRQLWLYALSMKK